MADDRQDTEPMVFTVEQIKISYDSIDVTSWLDDRPRYAQGAAHVTITLTWHGDKCPPGFEELGGQAVTLRRLSDG